MPRCLLVLLLVCAGLGAAETAPSATDAARVDRYVALFNPDLLALHDKRVVNPMSGAFDAPASDVARDVAHATWFSLLVFIPFLILPQALLIYIIFKYRKRADGRAPATFMGNHALEIVWTAIPILALAIVAIPTWNLLTRMDSPPNDQGDDMVVEVRGKRYAWDYKYQRLGGGTPVRREDQFEIGQDALGLQEPLVLLKDRRVILSLTSNDVNHGWWVPAFGVKKDSIRGRYTNTWFTPERIGLFKGQCSQLCGPNHGLMLISAVVVDDADFAVWCGLQRQRSGTAGVWNAISGASVDAKALGEAVGAYRLKAGDSFALRFWVASGFASMSRQPGAPPEAEIRSRRRQLDQLLAAN